MIEREQSWRLLLVGAAPRLLVAAGIIAILWLGFFWAITPPGAT